ncbi:hypothetical protein A8C75_19485 [Marinobacterium aestuarii]|uniref:Guanylate cyclase domain-containing protein n=1 Tax=Marinobacterium aestuarii TaxID=1821621 RepID=A0A1A9F3H4_9GAMM|nr:adenylate/guanylate cyclase domain-containing protein [Marinobacterium aestuarii]ANG64438.1 hypothetical protein A8C75_19485 [Marinobacterium aestuarii]
MRGERKIITALFADIVGSTALIQGLDPEDVQHLIEPVLELMVEAVQHYEGYVANTLGDGILAMFGAPVAHEDHPQRALYAALRMQTRIQQRPPRQSAQSKPLQIRVGIHTGEVLIRAVTAADLHVDYSPVGQAIHLASRLEGVASPGAVVVSQDTFRVATGYFEFSELGLVTVKGLASPVLAYQLQSEGLMRTRLQVAALRGLQRFIGRKAEVKLLLSSFEQSCGGLGQVVRIVGEPGVGKSRVFLEAKNAFRGRCRILEAAALSHRRSFACLPLIELLQDYFKLDDGDGDAVRRGKIDAAFDAQGSEVAAEKSYILFMLGLAASGSPLEQMESTLRRERTFDAIRRLLIRESRAQPLVVIIEDLQWLDSETEGFIDFLIDSITGEPILLLLSHRPEYRHTWDNFINCREIRLTPFGVEETGQLLSALLGDDASLDELKARIRALTEGNPFFMQEVVQALVEQQKIQGPAGRRRPVGRPAELNIPGTVQGVLSARIDRLPNPEKDLLQILAVIGRTFPWSLLQQIVDLPPETLRNLLTRLEGAEFLYQRPAFPEVVYGFTHALTQEVSYQSVPRERRRELHECTARAIETLHAGHLDEQCSALAHHYSLGAHASKALYYLQRAGLQAVRRSSHDEAIKHFTEALAWLERLPPGVDRTFLELQLRLSLGPVWMARRGYASDEVDKTYSRALELCAQAGDDSLRFTALSGLVTFYVAKGELATARRLAEQLLSLADRARNEVLKLEALGILGAVLFKQGELQIALARLEQGLTIYEAKKHARLAFVYGLDSGVLCLSFSALILAMSGQTTQALERSDAALSLSRELSHPVSLAFALEYAAELYQIYRDTARVRTCAEAAIEVSQEHGLVYRQAFGTVLLGWALAVSSQPAEGIDKIRSGLAAYRGTGAELVLPHLLGQLAEALGMAGDIDQALAAIEEAKGFADKNGERVYLSDILRLEAELLIRSAGTEASSDECHVRAETGLQQATSIARDQGNWLFELRALLSLHQLMTGQGRGKEARQLLLGFNQNLLGNLDMEELKTLRRLTLQPT